MKIIACVSDDYGMAFGARRVSRDSRVVIDILDSACDSAVYMSEGSKKLFPDNENARTDKKANDILSTDDYYFFETESPLPYVDFADEIILYNWNRSYPSDLKLGFIPTERGFKLREATEFPGTSHDAITKEVYVK